MTPADYPLVAAAGERNRPRFRRVVGAVSFATALALIAWLPLGILEVVPFIDIPGGSPLRTHAGAAVSVLLVAAWAYWER